MKLDFSREGWMNGDMTYAYSWRFEETPRFVQKDGYVESCADPEVTYGYDNISLMTRKKYTSGARVETECWFHEYGAPLIVIAKDMEEDGRGVLRYGEYYEIVLWEQGVNVWHLWPSAPGKVEWKLMLGAEFPVTAGERHILAVTVVEDMLQIEADEHRIKLRLENMYESYHLGIDACEGINRFYYLDIQE